MFEIMVKDADTNKILNIMRSVSMTLHVIKIWERTGYNITCELVGNVSERSMYNINKLGLGAYL